MSTKQKPLNKVDEEWNRENAEILQGMFGFSMNQVSIPALVMVQSQSAGIPDYRKHIGEIYNTSTGEFMESVELIFVGWNTPRAVLPYPFNPNAKQLCASRDSVAPYRQYIGYDITAKSEWDEQTFTVPELCTDCPLFESSLCTQMFRYFGFTVHNGQVFTMRLKRSAMDAAKALNFDLSQLAQRGQFMSFVMSTAEKSSEQGGSYFVPVFTVGNDASAYLRDAYQKHQALADRIKQLSEQRPELTSGEIE